MNNTLGKVISDYRKKLKISQKELASSITKEDNDPISPQYLNDIEKDRRIPSNKILNELGKKLKIDADFLFALAEKLPGDIKNSIANKDEKTIKNAYKAFRKTLN